MHVKEISYSCQALDNKFEKYEAFKTSEYPQKMKTLETTFCLFTALLSG